MKSRTLVFSLSPLPMWPMGFQQGMPSIAAAHRELARNGFDVLYLHVTRRVDYENPAVPGVEIVTASSWDLMEKNSLFQKLIAKFISVPLWVLGAIVASYPLLAKARREGKAIVLYGHTAPGSIAASLLGVVFRLPTVSRLYGTLTPYMLGLSTQYPVPRSRRLFNFLKQWDEIVAIRLPASRYVITDDGTLGDRMFEHIRGGREKLVFVRNGIDIGWDDWLAKPVDGSLFDAMFSVRRPVVISAGRLIQWKRMDRVIDVAFELVRRRGFDANFIILGNGELREPLEQKIRERGLADYVKIKSNVPHHDMPRYLLASDAVLLLQDFTNLSNTLLESLTLERPVVALDVGGTNTVLQHNGNGLLVPLEHWRDEATNAVATILADEATRERLRRGCRAWKAEHAYSWAKRAEVDVRLIRELTSTR